VLLGRESECEAIDRLRKVFAKLGIASRAELIRIELGDRPQPQVA
jgi:hypothetical protein